MQGSALSKLVIVFLVILSTVYVAFDVMASGGNAIGKLYTYILVGSGLLGLLAPRPAFIYLLIVTAFVDYFKRLMILDSGVQMKDIYSVLGIAPATLAGILASSAYTSLQSRNSLPKGQSAWVIMIFFGIAGVMALGLATQGRSGRALGDTVNLSVYISMLAAVPLLYRTPAELCQLLKILVMIYGVAGLYMIYHGIFGITDLEMEYVKSGLTIEIRQLTEGKFRPFGTMSNAGAASIMFSVLAALVVMGPWGKKGDSLESTVRGLGMKKFLLFLIFTGAAASTLTRTGWILGIVSLVAGLAFRHRSLTRLIYIGIAGIAAYLILGASWIMQSGQLDRLNSALANFSGSSSMDRQLTVLTFTDRLRSFENLTDVGRNWTPLGWKLAGRSESQKPFVHDAITDTLLRFGYVPLGIVAVLGFIGLFKLHHTILAEKSPMNRTLGAACAGVWLALVVGSLSTGTQLYLFPINVFLWFFPATVAGLAFYRRANPYEATVVVREPGLQGFLPGTLGVKASK